jgi:hypothetical protein
LVGLVALLFCPGCVWLQNEFFVYDAAPPPPDVQEESGTAARW